MRTRLHLLVAVFLAGLPLGACEPLQSGTLSGDKGPQSPSTQNPPDAGQTPDAGEPAPDAASIPCWQKRQLTMNVENMAFTFDAQGVGHFAFNRGSHVYVGSTRPGDVPTPVDELVGSVRDIAVDAQGQRHLVLNYSFMTSYAREQQGTWQHIELIPGSGPIKLRLDASGFAHMLLSISDYHDSDSTPGYAHVTNRTGSWEVTRIDSIPYGSSLTAMELDARSFAHIAYLNHGTSKGSYYATNVSGVWASELVTKVVGYELALALDSEGRPYLLYTSGGLFYHANKRKRSPDQEA